MNAKHKIYLTIFLFSLCCWQFEAQSRIRKALDVPTPKSSQVQKSNSVPTGVKNGSYSSGSKSSTPSLNSSTTRSNNYSGTTTNGTRNVNQNSNVIYLNVTKRADGKTSAVYGNRVGTKNGRRHVSGNGPGKQGKGHIVKKPSGRKVYHRKMNGTVTIDKKD